MLKINPLQTVLCFITILFAVRQIQLTAAANTTTVVTSPNPEPCQCLLLNCSCCQAVVIKAVDLNSKICLMFSLKLIPLKIGISIKLDNSTMIELLIDANNPPKYCIPILLPNSVAMCIKLHDIKLLGLTSVQICSTVYVSSQAQEVFTQKLGCVKLGSTGINLLR